MHTIRSFIRRNGRLTQGQQQALDTLWPEFGLDQQNLLDVKHIFQNNHPCFFEIGFGMGDSLIEMAQNRPDHNFIAVDVHLPGIGRLLNRIKQHQLDNVRVMNGDAVQLLKHYFPDNGLDGVLLFFPDPWPKKKHHKRRIVQAEFAQLIWQKLKPQGFFHMATDWQNYAEHMLAVMEQQQGWHNLAGQQQYLSRPEERPKTKFEQRGLRLGHGVWDLKYQKC